LQLLINQRFGFATQGKIEVKPRYKKVYAYNSNWEMFNDGIPFTNIKDASVKLGIPHSTISLAIRNGKLCKGKYYFRNSPKLSD
jgi:hypothetical protein